MKKILAIIIISLAISGGLAYKAVYIGQSGSAELREVTIKSGMNLNQISQELTQAGVLHNKFLFKEYLRFAHLDSSLKAGTYKIAGNLSLKELAGSINDTKSQLATDITIPEGWDLRDIAAELKKQGIIKNESELYAAVGTPASSDNGAFTALKDEYSFLKSAPEGYSLEGFLFPDTYRFFKNATLDDVLKKIFDNFQNKFDQQIQSELAGSGMNLYQALTLASIVAKEGKTFDDKKMIAGVYVNRINAGMALQADPTVNYANAQDNIHPDDKDLNVDSPYNTYKNKGLPPGPIANPGLEDILAALNPTKHNYYYFLSTKDGKAVFARTFEEHVANRQKYDR